MSWRVANGCAGRRFGSAARKQIIMFLADKASDDGLGIGVPRAQPCVTPSWAKAP